MDAVTEVLILKMRSFSPLSSSLFSRLLSLISPGSWSDTTPQNRRFKLSGIAIVSESDNAGRFEEPPALMQPSRGEHNIDVPESSSKEQRSLWMVLTS